MVRRACRGFGAKKNILVLNDEAHHCYRRKPDGEDAALSGGDRREAEKRNEEARLWISGLEAIQKKIGVRTVYDLSATPFFLRGSGWPEGTLFPWVVSDLSLIDAIESGIVKVPRVPVADNAMVGDQPTYHDLWLRIRDHLPKKGRGTEAIGGEPKLRQAQEKLEWVEILFVTLYATELVHIVADLRGKGEILQARIVLAVAILFGALAALGLRWRANKRAADDRPQSVAEPETKPAAWPLKAIPVCLAILIGILLTLTWFPAPLSFLHESTPNGPKETARSPSKKGVSCRSDNHPFDRHSRNKKPITTKTASTATARGSSRTCISNAAGLTAESRAVASKRPQSPSSQTIPDQLAGSEEVMEKT